MSKLYFLNKKLLKYITKYYYQIMSKVYNFHTDCDYLYLLRLHKSSPKL